jgi:N6-adenosine-specific RNA methylase IME4
MTELTKYAAARRALAEAVRVDEVKDIRDKAEAIRAYAHMAKDQQLELDATEIRARATRRIGEMMAAQPKAKPPGINQYVDRVSEKPEAPITLAEAGIDKNLAHQARQLAAMPEDEFEQTLTAWRDHVSAENQRVSINPFKRVDKAERRAERERELADKQIALPTKKYGVIVADPEWRFEPWSRETGMDRAADNHYSTSTLEVIKSRDVQSIAADDCVLFLWATAPMLPHAIDVMKAWDFGYRSNYVWVKDRIGTGYWNRNAHEHLLIGVRGKIPAPVMGRQWKSTVEALVGEHSAKPEIFLQMIEEYFPTLPKIELNRRGKARPGWSCWGLEAEQTDADASALPAEHLREAAE